MPRIFPILVLYKTQLKDAITYQTLLKNASFDQFMIYDNSPSSYIFDNSVLRSNMVYVRDVDNGGLSMAYNTGARYATANDYSHVLLLDQDTHFPPSAAEVYNKNLCCKSISSPMLKLSNGSAFSPCSRKGFKTKGVCVSPGIYNLSDYSPVNSGMCIPLNIFDSVGGYNENIRLDFADFEFISRCKSVCSSLTILPIVAVQNFSNEETDVNKLLFRYKLYLESALGARWPAFKEKVFMHIEVLCHTMSLTRRTKSISFIKMYIKDFLQNK